MSRPASFALSESRADYIKRKFRKELAKSGVKRPEICPQCNLKPRGRAGVQAFWAEDCSSHRWLCRACITRETSQHRAGGKIGSKFAYKAVAKPAKPKDDRPRVPFIVMKPSTLANKRPRDPNTIYIAGNIVARGDVRVSMEPSVRRLFLILAARVGQPLSQFEILEVLFGDDIDGGPDWAGEEIRRLLVAVRDAGALLGYRVDQVTKGVLSMHAVPYAAMEIAA